MAPDLIFIASQPRAGSTLLQRLLASHSTVATTSEPWVLLPLLAWRKPEFIGEARYNNQLANLGVRTFLESIPEGEEAYFEAVRCVGESLYGRVLNEADATVFLDKTPRYYYILPDIRRVFPNAHIILLFRNPLSVLASILTTWVRGDWLTFHRYQDDLLAAPGRLLDATDMQNTSVVRYEELVRDSSGVMRTLCDNLGLSFEPEVMTYDSSDTWTLGDQTQIEREQRPVMKSVEKWKQVAAENPQAWKVLTDYLRHLGPRTVEKMGYNFDSCEQALQERAPSQTRGLFSLKWLLRKPYDERNLVERAAVRLQDAFLTGGLREASQTLIQKSSRYVTGSS